MLPDYFRKKLDAGGPDVRRLRPPAYADDPLKEAEYRGLMDDELSSGRLHSIAIFEETIDAERLDEEQATAWLGAVNDMRLVLGTELDVTEEMPMDVPESDPRFQHLAIYGYLTFIEGLLIEALAANLH